MSDSVKFNRTNSENLNSIPYSSGSITFTKDEKGMYVDFPGNAANRIKISDIEIIPANSNITQDKLKLESYISNKFNNKLYIFTESRDMMIYHDSNWISFNNHIYNGISNGIYETNDEFNINDTEVTISTTMVSNEVVLGSLIIDKYHSLGLITSISENIISIKLLIDNRKANKVTNHIYLDNTYDGEEFGTLEKPFTLFSNLYKKCKDELVNGRTHTVIHIMNNDLTDSGYFKDIVNCTFIGHIDAIAPLCFVNCNNIKLYDLNLKALEFTGNRLTLINSNISNECYITSDEVHIDKSDCNVFNISNNKETIYSDKNINLINVTGSLIFSRIKMIHPYTTTINIRNSNINILTLHETDDITADINFENTHINEIFDNEISLLGDINFASGSLNNRTLNVECNNIDLGVFDFKGCTLNLNAVLKPNTGLSSKQIYDNSGRNYGQTNSSLESHLEAIDEYLIYLDDECFYPLKVKIEELENKIKQLEDKF